MISRKVSWKIAPWVIFILVCFVYSPRNQRVTPPTRSAVPVNSRRELLNVPQSTRRTHLSLESDLVTGRAQPRVRSADEDLNRRVASWSKQHGATLSKWIHSSEQPYFLPRKNDRCRNAKRPPRYLPPPREGTYQELTPNHTWVMSAHLDLRATDRSLVRVFGLSRVIEDRESMVLNCQLWDRSGILLAVAKANVSGIHNFGYKIESFQLTCDFHRDVGSRSEVFVSIVYDGCDVPNNIMRLHNNYLTHKPYVDMTVCICGPTKFNYSDHQRFIEWMEVNRILGIKRTHIYNAGVANIMLPIFEYYTKKGWLSVYDVNVPYIDNDERWITKKGEDPAYAKMSMRHDCMMREMFRSRYLVIIDLDETVAPRSPDTYTLMDMVRSAGCENRSHLMVRNMFFRRDWPDDPTFSGNPEVSSEFRLLTLMTTQRDEYIYPRMMRSKNILRPENTLAASTHRAWTYPELREARCDIPPRYGTLHHYKFREYQIKMQRPVLDRTMHKYSKPLIDRVRKVYHDLQDVLPKQ